MLQAEVGGRLTVAENLPSSQFRTTYEKMTCAATNFCLQHFLLGVTQDGLDWGDDFKYSLCRANSDPLEGLHGAGREYFGNDVNFTGAGWCRIVTRLMVQAEMKTVLQSHGMEFADAGCKADSTRAKHLRSTIRLPLTLVRAKLQRP